MARRRKSLTIAAAVLSAAAASAVLAPSPANAAFGDQVFFFNSAGGVCNGQPVANGTCAFHSTGRIGYGGYGPYDVVAKKDGVVVFTDTCPAFQNCTPEANAPADADYVFTLHFGIGSLAGGTID